VTIATRTLSATESAQANTSTRGMTRIRTHAG
jgi:hypothetical protein